MRDSAFCTLAETLLQPLDQRIDSGGKPEDAWIDVGTRGRLQGSAGVLEVQVGVFQSVRDHREVVPLPGLSVRVQPRCQSSKKYCEPRH